MRHPGWVEIVWIIDVLTGSVVDEEGHDEGGNGKLDKGEDGEGEVECGEAVPSYGF